MTRPEDLRRRHVEPLRQVVEERFSRLRAGTRGLLLPLLAWPLGLDLIVEVIQGDSRGAVAAALGLGLPLLAVRKLRRGRIGDTARAAILMAVATGLVAGLGAKLPVVIALMLAFGAWFGTRLLYDGAVQEVEAPAEPAPPPPPGPLAEAEARLARLQALGDARLIPVLGSMAAVLEDLSARPERLPLARRFLTVHLDGLERIADRLTAGAEPPPGLDPLLQDLQGAAEGLIARLRAEESAALDIQVKVLADRLRQEGYA
jgi:hypothetical protein